jgi:flotillin
LPALVDSQMKAISNLKIDKIVIWGGGDNAKSGVSSLLKDLMTGLPPVTDLARATGVELPPVLGRVQSSLASIPEQNGKGVESAHLP